MIMYDYSMLSLSLLSFFLCPVRPSLHVYLFLSHTLSLCPSCSLSLSKNFPLYMYYLSQKKIIKCYKNCQQLPRLCWHLRKVCFATQYILVVSLQFCFLSQSSHAFKQDLYLLLFDFIFFALPSVFRRALPFPSVLLI